jgi:hypothetical protein
VLEFVLVRAGIELVAEMRKSIQVVLFLVILAGGSNQVLAQGFAWGLKGGLTTGYQQWDQSSFSSRGPLYAWHGIAFIESLEEAGVFSLFAQAGYHVKGSSIRTYSFQSGSIFRPVYSIPFKFNNASLILGGKQRKPLGNQYWYYLLGVRGDYTVSTKLRPDNVDPNDRYFALLYPFDAFVRKFNYGVTVGGGLELKLGDLIGTMIELTVNPDFSLQYQQPSIPNVPNPNVIGGSTTITLPERRIRNLTIELTLGFRFLNQVVYED